MILTASQLDAGLLDRHNHVGVTRTPTRSDRPGDPSEGIRDQVQQPVQDAERRHADEAHERAGTDCQVAEGPQGVEHDLGRHPK